MTLDGRWQPKKNTEETAMSAEEMNKIGDFSKFYDMRKVSLVMLLKF